MSLSNPWTIVGWLVVVAALLYIIAMVRNGNTATIIAEG